jgi:restriction endonuclease S subunit
MPHPSSSDATGHEVCEISPSEFPQHGYLNTCPRSRRVNASDLSQRSRQIIQPGDILLASKGAIGRTALCRSPDRAATLVASPSIIILRLQPAGPIQDTSAFLMYLRSPLFQAQLRAITVGTTIPNISPADLRRLPIAVPTVEEQHELRQAFETQLQLQHQIQHLQREQAVIEHSVLSELDLAELGEAP